MSFSAPWFLLLLLLPAGLGIFLLTHGGRLVPLPFDHQPLQRRRFLSLLLKSAEFLPILLLIVAILILAGPKRLEPPRDERQVTNILFCLDVSGSMTTPFGGGSRYDAAMDALNSFISYRKGDAFGLTAFGSAILNWVPLTTDVSAFRCAPPFLRPENLPPWFGGTMIGMALRSAQKSLTATSEGDRMIMVITDGASADLGNGENITIANSLKADGILVYAVFIGEGSPPDDFAVISTITGGEVFSAGDPSALQTVFGRIDAMQKAPLKRVAPDPVDFFGPFAIAGLVISGLYLLTLFGLRHTPW